MAMRELLPDFFQYDDSCNVYVIRRGDRAIAIDFGTGGVLKELSAIGVTGLDWIVHTHHHRDQCVGDHLAVAQGVKLAVPEWEAHYFLEAEHFWGRRNLFHLYNMRTNYFTLRESVPVAAFLQVGLGLHFWLNILLTLMFDIPGIIHALWLVLTDKT